MVISQREPSSNTLANGLGGTNSQLHAMRLTQPLMSCPSCQTNSPHRNVYRNLLLGCMGRPTLFPVVRAEGTSNQKASTDSQQPKTDSTSTTIDKLGLGVPQILVSDQQVKDYLDRETGRQRLKELFSYDNENNLHPDLQQVVTNTAFLSITGFCVMSVFGSRAAREKFIQKNQSTKFETKFKALRAYHDAIYIGSIKTGLLWSIKVSVFGLSFMLTSLSVSTYRNKSGFIEYLAGGAVTGSILRLNLGLKGFVAGGIIGGVLGGLAGTMMYFLLAASNQTQEEKHYWHVHEKLLAEKKLKDLLGTGVPKQQPQLQQTVPS